MTSKSTWACADTRQALGVYVLGAIDPAERALVDEHVASCDDCRAELADLAGLTSLLSRVDADEIGLFALEDTGQPPAGAGPQAADRPAATATQLHEAPHQPAEGPRTAEGTPATEGIPADEGTPADEATPRPEGAARPDLAAPPEDFIDSLVSLTAARRRRTRRWQLLATAAAVVIAAGGAAAGYQLANGAPGGTSAEPAPPASWQTANTTSTMNGVAATIRYQKLAWGVAYDVQITGVPAGTTCQLWVTDNQGVHLLSAGWTVSSKDPDPWYPGSSWVPGGQVKGMDVTAGNEELATFTTR
ncbi:MAG: zf-HC2 domain-containing protein [Actinobacteria bacterium]|nr:zf-HC2 domain-containing protein [Actinomycetota bacterium]